MASIEVDFDLFFDRGRVATAVERKSNRVLGRQGAFYRKIVRRSMKSAGKNNDIHSKPGRPPRFITRLLKDNIFFQRSRAGLGVVVGARRLNTRVNVPELLEYGGQVTGAFFFTKEARTRDPKTGKFRKAKRRLVQGDFTMRPRPFVGPRSVNYPVGEKEFRRLMVVVPLR